MANRMTSQDNLIYCGLLGLREWTFIRPKLLSKSLPGRVYEEVEGFWVEYHLYLRFPLPKDRPRNEY